MTATRPLPGVIAPALTPFTADLKPDAGRLAAHCRWLLKAGVGLAPFGTTSEANSMSADQRMALLEALIDQAIDPAHMLAGTGSCALDEAVRLSRHATGLGCAGVLVLPPFYYKAVSDEGLFSWFAALIERVADSRLRVFLYHIPPIAQVGFSADLVERLVRSFPGVVAGIKDSSGDWSNTMGYLERNWDSFRIYVGTERRMLQNLSAGGAGCISATANVNPGGLVDLLRGWQSGEADTLNERAVAVRDLFEAGPMIPALKAVLAAARDDEAWALPHPPLLPLDADAGQRLLAGLAALDFPLPA